MRFTPLIETVASGSPDAMTTAVVNSVTAGNWSAKAWLKKQGGISKLERYIHFKKVLVHDAKSHLRIVLMEGKKW
jgi:hypothetical protein